MQTPPSILVYPLQGNQLLGNIVNEQVGKPKTESNQQIVTLSFMPESGRRLYDLQITVEEQRANATIVTFQRCRRFSDNFYRQIWMDGNNTKPLEVCSGNTRNRSAISDGDATKPRGRINGNKREPRPSAPTPVSANAAVRTPPRMDPNHPLKIGEEWYPDASRRANEEGRCIVQMTIGADGRVAAETLQKSTGFPLLDDACLKAVHGPRMLPATENGKPVETTVGMPIIWKLTK